MVKYGFVTVSCLFKNVLALFHLSESLYTVAASESLSECMNGTNIIERKMNKGVFLSDE